MTNKEFQAFLSFFPPDCKVWFSIEADGGLPGWQNEKKDVYFFTIDAPVKEYELDEEWHVDEDKLAIQENIASESFDYEEWFDRNMEEGKIYILKLSEAITHPTLPRDKIKHIIF